MRHDPLLPALAAAWPRPSTLDPLGQRLIVLGGLPASGKSTFARNLAEQATAVHISADAVRMTLTADQPVYSQGESRRTKRTVAALVETFLADGHSVVVDAINIRRRDRRGAVALGRRRNVPTLLVWCEVDEATASERLAHRMAGMDPADRSRADHTERRRLALLVEAPGEQEADATLFLRPEHHESVMAASCAFGTRPPVATQPA